MGLVGINGAGKTTLLRAIAGLIKPSSGIIEKSNVLYLPESYRPLEKLTGQEYLSLTCKCYGCDVDEYALEVLDFDKSSLPKLIKTYSKGMRQKLGLAMAFSTNCKALVLDEPMSGLDPIAREGFKQLLSGSKAAVLLTSHSLGDVDTLCDDICVLHQGQLYPVNNTLEHAFFDIVGHLRYKDVS